MLGKEERLAESLLYFLVQRVKVLVGFQLVAVISRQFLGQCPLCHEEKPDFVSFWPYAFPFLPTAIG